MDENYLAKWLNNELSEEELKEFQDSEEFASYSKIIAASSQLEAPEFDVESALNTLNSNKASETKVIALKPYKNFLRVAAVIAFLMIGSYLYLNTLNTTKVSTQFAENTSLQLPDASEVVLNADSKISFSKKNWENNRDVQLEGEAFFKVAKGKKFTVSTDLGMVTVLGTQFNVESRKGYFEVSCFEGLVKVTYQGKELKLPAGKSITSYNNELVEGVATLNGSPSWTRDESSFSSIPLKFVIAELERQYDLKVSLKNVDENQLFTGSFSNTNLKIALESISTPTRLKYEQRGNNVLFYAENTP